MDRQNPHTKATALKRPRWTRRRLVVTLAAIAPILLLTAVGCSDDEDAAAQEDAASSIGEAATEDGTTTTTTTTTTPSEPNETDDRDETGASSDPRVVRAGEAPPVTFAGDTMHCIATAEQTSGSYSMLEIQIPTGSGPTQQQSGADQWFFFLDGTASVEVGDLATDVSAGDYVHVPKMTTFSLTATTDVRLLAGFVPGGFEAIFGCPA